LTTSCIEKAADPNALFFIFHLLGEWREKSAYRSLAAFLRLPRDVLETILGDCITETTHRVMGPSSMALPIRSMRSFGIPKPTSSSELRCARRSPCWTRRSELPRDATAAFLRDCYAQLEPQKDCYVEWLGRCGVLARVDELNLWCNRLSARSIDPIWLAFKDFEEDLQYTVDHQKPNASCRW